MSLEGSIRSEARVEVEARAHVDVRVAAEARSCVLETEGSLAQLLQRHVVREAVRRVPHEEAVHGVQPSTQPPPLRRADGGEDGVQVG